MKRSVKTAAAAASDSVPFALSLQEVARRRRTRSSSIAPEEPLRDKLLRLEDKVDKLSKTVEVKLDLLKEDVWQGLVLLSEIRYEAVFKPKYGNAPQPFEARPRARSPVIDLTGCAATGKVPTTPEKTKKTAK